ncbi:single-stranded DNA-binding protein [Pendulispora rubella]|uniref:Single-stranded DNA-binding protein n=1 Tax=Pendulispora rubella TaxID=2741070 RepID=A0ABZ2LGD3_9BACT
MSAIKCIFTGKLGRDAEIRTLPRGSTALSFPVATTKRWITAEGVRRTKTIWVRCSMFGHRVGALAEHLTRGTTVFVLDGELTLDRKDSDAGVKEYWGVVVRELSLGRRGAPRSSRPSADDQVEQIVEDTVAP